MIRIHPVNTISARRRRGSVLVIVMWICLGLVALALYFANSMSSEMHASDNRLNEVVSRQAVAGGQRYAAYALGQYALNGSIPNLDPNNPDFYCEALPIGQAQVWYIGRDNNTYPINATDPTWGVVDESSKLNLNTASRTMIEALLQQLNPNYNPDLVDAIIAWRTASGTTGAAGDPSSGADDSNYQSMDPPRRNKGGKFETVDELRLVYAATLDQLLGEDYNRNGVLDPNENDGDTSAPHDDQDGQLMAGLMECVTVYSSLPATGIGGSRRVNITTPQGRRTLQQTLSTRLGDDSRAAEIVRRVGNNANFNSVAAFYLASGMSDAEWLLVHTNVTAATATNGVQAGLININTASVNVLACIPGIGLDYAQSLVQYREAHPTDITSFAWVSQVLPAGNFRQAGPYITDQSYQFSADIAAVGPHGRGYCREKYVYDMSTGTPRVVYRQDLTAFGWALGQTVRQSVKIPKQL